MKTSSRSIFVCVVCLVLIYFGGCGGSGSSGGGGGNQNNPTPTVASLSPASASQYGPAFTLTVTGTGFISSSQIQWNGASLTTTYASATGLTAQVPAADLSATGSFDVKVVNPAPGGGASNAIAFTVGNPVPALTSISPASAPAAGAPFTLTAAGSNFINGSVIQWNGAALATTYVSATQLAAQVPAADVAATGSFDVKVVNPAPGGGASNAIVFTVGNPVPVLASISPASVPAASAAFTLTANGSKFISGSVIQWNGAALATTYISTTQLTAQVPASDLATGGASSSANVTVFNPAPNGGTSNAVQFSILQSTGTRVVTINLPANDIAWDETHSRIYASLPSTDANGNSVVAIDPVTATVGTPVAVGSEPRPLALSGDNSLLYVGLDGSGQVKRLNLPALTVDPSVNLQLRNDPAYGQLVALALAVAPGAPNTFAAILGNYAWTPADVGGTAIYDNATPRSGILSRADNVNDSALEWGADTSTLYANQGAGSGNDLYVMSVGAGGLGLTADYGYLVPTQYGKLHYDPQSKYLYVDGGRVVDPATGDVIATFNTSPLAGYIAPLCALDLKNGVVFFLGQTFDQFSAFSGVTIESFDARTYLPLATLTIPAISGHPIRLLRWGNAGLAFNMSGGTSSGNYLLQPPGGPIYLVDGTFVNAAKTADFTSGTAIIALPVLASMKPEIAFAGSNDTTLTVTGANFSSTAVVMWNGTALNSSVASDTQITATIPAADLATPGTAIVSVSDPASSLASTTSLAFTIAPSGTTSGVLALNLASLDLAWDAIDSRLMVPVWSADPRYPNSILSVDPTTGAISKSATVASDPDLVRVTDDGSLVYVGFRTVNSVASLNLPNLGASSTFSLGADPFYGPYYAYDLQPAPGAPRTTAIAFAVNGAQPPESNGMTVFDSGAARPNASSRSIGFQTIQWRTNSTLYAVDNAASLYSYGVDASGLTLNSRNLVLNTSSTSSLKDIHFDAGTGYLYDDNGWVIDPSNGSIVGDFQASGLAIPDSALHRVFILGQLAAQSGTSNYTIQSFDQATFTLAHSLTLHSLVGTPVAFVRWGSTGLALVTYNQNADATNGPAGMLYILSDSNLVSAHAVTGTTVKSERVHAFPMVRPRTLSIPATRTEGTE